MDCRCCQTTNLQWEGATHRFQDEQSQTSNLWMVAFSMDTSARHGSNDYQRLGENKDHKSFHI